MGTVVVVGWLASWFPVHFVTRRYFEKGGRSGQATTKWGSNHGVTEWCGSGCCGGCGCRHYETWGRANAFAGSGIGTDRVGPQHEYDKQQ